MIPNCCKANPKLLKKPVPSRHPTLDSRVITGNVKRHINRYHLDQVTEIDELQKAGVLSEKSAIDIVAAKSIERSNSLEPKEKKRRTQQSKIGVKLANMSEVFLFFIFIHLISLAKTSA